MEIKSRESINDRLNKYCYLTSTKDDFIEITKWANDEGWDIEICRDNNVKTFSLTYGELDAINYLTKYLEYKAKK